MAEAAAILDPEAEAKSAEAPTVAMANPPGSQDSKTRIAENSPALWAFLEVGARSTAADFYLASRKMHLLTRRMARFHETYDIILSPTLSNPPCPVPISTIRRRRAIPIMSGISPPIRRSTTRRASPR